MAQPRYADRARSGGPARRSSMLSYETSAPQPCGARAIVRNTENPVRAFGVRLICVKAPASPAQAQSAPDCREATTIMAAFTLRALAPDQILSVYPLIREAMPAVDLTAWTELRPPSHRPPLQPQRHHGCLARGPSVPLRPVLLPRGQDAEARQGADRRVFRGRGSAGPESGARRPGQGARRPGAPAWAATLCAAWCMAGSRR